MHRIGWALLTFLCFVQSPGLTAPDTKHDLVANPAGFLAGALSAWSDTFPLGQVQNQAYGYLFPQGLFFLLAHPLPDWIAQRLWWSLALCIGWSGFLRLTETLDQGTPLARALGAAAFVLSPHTLTTLGAISSETWPTMLAPWVVLGVLGRNPWVATLAVACMGAVNATATIAACVPAAVIALWQRRFLVWVPWALVSVWWIVPLFVLGKYAPPFTDYIENAAVTTRWLNLTEVLRGTTSWTPYVTTERLAGHQLVVWPEWVLITCAVAGLGMFGLRRLHPVWRTMFLLGVLILAGSVHATALLDGPLVALRNIHKFDVVLRLPLCLGIAALPLAVRWNTRRDAAILMSALCVVVSLSPAFRLLPEGSYPKVPGYWREAAAWLNEHARDTRTMILPPAQFARFTWGNTRDEPLQPLLDVPWVVRDAIPLVPPETIRGLDGISAVADPFTAARRLGVGVVVIRKDLLGKHDLPEYPESAEVHEFGEVDIVVLDRTAGMMVTDTAPVKVAGGGEVLALLDQIGGYQPRELVSEGAEIVTDTPMHVERNFGRVDGAVSAPLPENATVRDYASAGPRTYLETSGPKISASSAGDSIHQLGWADPARSVSAAVDNQENTAWFPVGRGWIALHGEFHDPVITLRGTRRMEVKVNGEPEILRAGVTEKIQLLGDVSTVRVDVAYGGIAEIGVAGHPTTHRVVVPDTSPNVQQFVFQRIFVPTGMVLRRFTAPRDMEVRVECKYPVTLDGHEHECGSTVPLKRGTHDLATRSEWVTLTTPEFSATRPGDRLLVTGRAYNPGMRAFLGATELAPRAIDADTQAFEFPHGDLGDVRFEFAGDRPYRSGLVGGGALAFVVLATLLLRRRKLEVPVVAWRSSRWLWVFSTAVAAITAGPVGAIAALAGSLSRNRYFTLVGIGLAGLWLAHAPWPELGYAGDRDFLAWACCVSLGALAPTQFPKLTLSRWLPARGATAPTT
ncbi:alpha-(1-_3)-arabinofuranosyltransferase family protein [Corynebacterium sp.]|uniref:alpha-(1->3)-arabinofuranosyltransferase domain-containing protein n=1 Tax=Corynebacterium sp. TaxID=1720 RepID=UPI0026DCCDE1|nr:alpha-(1->3)-arabinofuranosyltransferase family protein [Corynebacterium sp.]MDO5076745.1 alpha-(1->3)-arabinofuranosyltransferase family protein [Corynebacterium sp.]